ncbi:MAG: TonB family protein [Paludibacter sp.]|nr:TonB family protein [Paludibacter sp.]
MNEFVVYLLKVNIAIAMFYMFYKLFFAGDTLWRARRIYMLSAILLSFAYPFFSIEGWLQQQETVKEFVMNYAVLPEFTVGAEEQTTFFSLNNLLASTYVLIMAVLSVRLLLQLVSILRIKHSGHYEIIQNVRVLVVEKEIAPFSFFATIYINPTLHTEAETAQILTHELTHVRQWHSLDVMLSEFLCIAFWINPAAWLLKREIRQNLEFLADDKVLSSGFDSKSYQYHLLQLSYQTPDYKLSNKFNILPLKKRIIMMNQKKSSKSTALKYLLIAPLTFSLVVISNAESLAGKAAELVNNPVAVVSENVSKIQAVAEKQIVVSLPEHHTEIMKPEVVLPEDTVKVGPDDVIFTVVEQMPKFPGGNQAMFKYLSENIRYPENAHKNGIQGRVICQFVVDSEGKVTAVEVVRGVDRDLDLEALRVVKAMPAWEPGRQKGKPVRVKYTLPINFRLDGKDKNKLNEKDFSSFTNLPSDKQPLLVIDDKIVPMSDLSKYKSEAIQSITVLKDAAATEKYGEKGKNGVIILKLK